MWYGRGHQFVCAKVLSFLLCLSWLLKGKAWIKVSIASLSQPLLSFVVLSEKGMEWRTKQRQNNFSLGGDALKQITIAAKEQQTTASSPERSKQGWRVRNASPLVLPVSPLLSHALVCLLTYRIIFFLPPLLWPEHAFFYLIFIFVFMYKRVYVCLHTGHILRMGQKGSIGQKWKHSSNKQICTRVG